MDSCWLQPKMAAETHIRKVPVIRAFSILLLLWVILILADTTTAHVPLPSSNCPESCLCFGNNGTVTCSGQHALTILHLIPLGTTALTLTNMRRNDSDAFRSFGHLESLRQLTFSDCRIGPMRQGLFDGLASLTQLSITDCDLGGSIPKGAFAGLHRVTTLTLSRNGLRSLPAAGFTAPMPALRDLDLSGNPFVTLNRSQFSPAPSLRSLVLTGLPRLVAVHAEAFSPLPQLRALRLSDNPVLEHVSTLAFGVVALEELDLSNNALSTVSWASRLPSLRRLVLHGNRWRCDCGVSWLRDVHAAVANNTPAPLCSHPKDLRGKDLLDAAESASNCTVASALTPKEPVDVRPGSSALLECHVAGNPRPNTRWITPQLTVLHWYPDDVEDGDETGGDGPLPPPPPRRHHHHPSAHDRVGNPLSVELSHVQVLRNGNLFVTKANSADAGTYWCVADNALGSSNSSVALRLDYEILSQVKVVSVLVGLASAVAFMLAMLLVQLLNTVLDRWGWECCCCTRCGALPPKARRFKAVFEGVEQYKSQQLDRLRDNYQQQMQKVKDNGAQQMEWLRDSYSSQVEKLKDLRDYGTHQLDRIRDQYYDQVRRVRDYTASQMNRVRENYIFQRNRIRKFSAHQLVRLRENYKLQQMHLNKILENLNLESCRTVAGQQRSDSVVFTSASGADLAACVRIDFPPLMRPREGSSSFDDDDDDGRFPSLVALSARALEEAAPYEVAVASSSSASASASASSTQQQPLPQDYSESEAV